MLFFRACHHVPFWSSFWSNVYQPDISSLSEDNIEKLYLQQSSKYVRGILAYASTLESLLKNWTTKYLTGNANIKAVFSGSEILTDEIRSLAKEFWPNANIVSRYSNMENGILGQDDGTPNQFNLNWASYYIEILKFDSDEPAQYGEIGRVVITDMHNRAFPMIRYDNGDVGAMIQGEDGWPKIINLGGRRIDMIYDTNGKLCSPHAITNTMWGVKGNIIQWQFIQETKDHYIIKYASNTPNDAEKGLNEKIELLKNILGKDAVITTKFVTEIPVLNSGKRKPIVSLLNN